MITTISHYDSVMGCNDVFIRATGTVDIQEISSMGGGTLICFCSGDEFFHSIVREQSFKVETK